MNPSGREAVKANTLLILLKATYCPYAHVNFEEVAKLLRNDVQEDGPAETVNELSENVGLLLPEIATEISGLTDKFIEYKHGLIQVPSIK